MGTVESRINRAMAAIIDEERSARRVTVADLAAESSIPYGTLRRILGGRVDVNVPDLTALAGALSAHALRGRDEADPITPQQLLARAVERAGGYDVVYGELLSEVGPTKDDLARLRAHKEAAGLSPAEIATRATAATRDPALDADEPPTP